MSAAEASPILIPSEDEEDEGDDVQYIKEEKALPITISETEDQDDVIFVATCPAPPTTLPPWDDALALDMDNFHIPTPTSSCSSDVPAMAGGSSLSGPFCSISAILDNSTPPSLSSATTNSLLATDLTADVKMPLSVLGSDLSLGAGSDLTGSDASTTLSTLSGAALALSSMTSDLAALSDSSLTLPSVSGTLSNGLPGSCARGLPGSKTALGTDSSLFSMRPASSPLDLSRRDKVRFKVTLRKKMAARRPQYSPSVLSDLDISSSSDSTSDSDSHCGTSSNNDDPMDNSDDLEKSDGLCDDPGNDDDDDSALPNYRNLLGLALASGQNGLLSNSSGGLLSNSSGGLLSNSSGGLLSNSSGGLLSNGSGGLLSNGSGGLLSNSSGGLLSNGSGGLLKNNNSSPSQPSSSSLASCSNFQTAVADVLNGMSQALSASSSVIPATTATTLSLGASVPSSATQLSFSNTAQIPAPANRPVASVSARAGGPTPSTSSLVLGLGCSDSGYDDGGCQQLSVNSQPSVKHQQQSVNQHALNQVSVTQVSVNLQQQSVNLQQQSASSVSVSPQVSMSLWSGGSVTSVQPSSSTDLLFQPSASVSGAPAVKQQMAGSTQAAPDSGALSEQKTSSDYLDRLFDECKIFLSGLPHPTASTASSSSTTVVPACAAGSSTVGIVSSSYQSLTAPSTSSQLVSVSSSSSQLLTAACSSSQAAAADRSLSQAVTTDCSSSQVVTAACSSSQAAAADRSLSQTITTDCSSSQVVAAACSSSQAVSGVLSSAPSFTATCDSSLSVMAACSSSRSATAACSSSRSLSAGCSLPCSVLSSSSSVDTDPLMNSLLQAFYGGEGNDANSCVGPKGRLDKSLKRSSTTSICSLDVASLPPRKRVLKHSISTPSSVSHPASAPGQLSAGSAMLDVDNTPSGPVQQQVTTPGPSGSSGQDVVASRSGVTSGQDVMVSRSGITPGMSGSGVMSVVEMCKSCGKLEGVVTGDGEEECKISHCPSQHPACGGCLMVQARRILTGKQKETLKCLDVTCNSFYHINELKKSLPSLIVDILQERADQDMVGEIMDIIDQQRNSSSNNSLPGKHTKSSSRKKTPQTKRMQYTSSSSDADDEDDDDYEEGADENGSFEGLMSELDAAPDAGRNSRRRDSNDDQGQNDFPEHWSPMDNSKNLVEVVAVPLEPDSEEYVKVAVRFHEHMHFPAADITRIVRIQNPYLWKSYSLKKEQMVQENGGRMVNEYQLFHGTKVSAIDAICRRGFDWRFCGKNGTAYGQGCYFAGDSLYSNTYTDRGSAPSQGSTLLKSIMPLTPTSSADPTASTSGSAFLSDLSLSNPTMNSQQHLNQLHGPMRFGGPSGSGKTNLSMKRLLPLLKSKVKDPTCLAQLLKAKTDKLRANIAAGYAASSASRPGSGSGGSRTASGNLVYGPTAGSAPLPPQHMSSGHLFVSGHSMGNGSRSAPAPSGPPLPSAPHHSRSAPSRHQQVPSQSSVPPHRQTLFTHQRYSLLAGPSRSHSSAPPPSQSFTPGQSLHSAPQSMHGVANPGQPPSSTFGGIGKVGVYHHAPASKKYGVRSGINAGKVPSLMVRSSSSAQQVAPPPAQPLSSQGSGSMIVPMGNYPTSLSVSSSSVTLTGGGGGAMNLSGGAAPSLTLLTTNNGLQPSSYLLVAQPVLNPTPAPIPPFAPLPPHAVPLLSQPGPPPLPPPPPVSKGMSSSWSSVNQALDLRKSGSCPRYMFLAKVLSGMATGGQSDYRRPPPLDPQDPLGRCYDSCVDNIHTPRIWVIFDSTQAYPEYAIEYVVNGDGYR